MRLLAIPDEGVDGGGLSLLVIGAALAAALLLALGLRRLRGRPGLAPPALGAAGLLLAIGAALYVHDAVALPEIVGTLLIGGGLGYLLARQVRLRALPNLSAALLAGCGVAGLLAGWGALIDPAALGITAFGRLCLHAAMALSLVVAAGAVLRRGVGARLLLGGLTGLAAAAFGFAFGNLPLILAGGVLGAAGCGLAGRAAMSKRAACASGE